MFDSKSGDTHTVLDLVPRWTPGNVHLDIFGNFAKQSVENRYINGLSYAFWKHLLPILLMKFLKKVKTNHWWCIDYCVKGKWKIEEYSNCKNDMFSANTIYDLPFNYVKEKMLISSNKDTKMADELKVCSIDRSLQFMQFVSPAKSVPWMVLLLPSHHGHEWHRICLLLPPLLGHCILASFF